MLKQIRQLAGIQLINLFGINEVRHTKDKKKRARYAGLAVCWAMLIVMLIGYVVALSAGLAIMGMVEIIPMYLFAISSMIMLFFTFFKAGSVIFQMNSYELLISLPVTKTAIVVSRFLTMYVTNFMLALLVMLPGVAVYGVMVKPGIAFYVYSILGTVFLPLLPLSIATALGAGITAISSRMRNKSLVSAGLTILFVVVITVVSMAFSGEAEQLDMEVIKNMASVLGGQIEKIYPPAVWFSEAAVDGILSSFLLLAGSSLLVFVLLVAVLQRYFAEVCAALSATSAKNNYKMQRLSTSSPLAALWKRELKRYFASSIYVSNTVIGYILMAVMAVALLFVGTEKIETMLQLPGVVAKALPLILSLMAVIAPTTACAVSLEGKQWWIAQTLPVRSRDIWNSKLLVNLTIAAPFYFLTVILAIIAVRPSFMEGVWIVVIPAAYILFSSVAGLFANLAIPVFQWENETNVVKQGAAVLVAMLMGFFCVLVPGVCLIALQNVSKDMIYFVTTVLLLVITLGLHMKNCKKTVLIGE